MYYYTLAPDFSIGGPFTAVSMMEMQATGTIHADTPAAAAGDTSWVPLVELIPAIREEVDNVHAPLRPEDFNAQVQAARKTGPPTLPVLTRLLNEDAAVVFPRPRRPQP